MSIDNCGECGGTHYGSSVCSYGDKEAARLEEVQRRLRERSEASEAPSARPIGCTCGSGAHPRRCVIHPQRVEKHVAEINAEWNKPDEPPYDAVMRVCDGPECTMMVAEPAAYCTVECRYERSIDKAEEDVVSMRDKVVLERERREEVEKKLAEIHGQLGVRGDEFVEEAAYRLLVEKTAAEKEVEDLTAEVKRLRADAPMGDGALLVIRRYVGADEDETTLEAVQRKIAET